MLNWQLPREGRVRAGSRIETVHTYRSAAAMRRLIAAALVATLAGCAQGDSVDFRRVQFEMSASLPSGPPIQYRPTAAVPFRLMRPARGGNGTLFGNVTIDQLEPDRLRISYAWTGVRFGPGDSQDPETAPQLKLPTEVLLRRFEVRASGKYLSIDPPPFPSSGADAKDWVSLFEEYESLPVYRADLAVGSPIMPSTLAELFDKRVELLEAMVRGNTGGYWIDLPRGGAMTKEQRDALTASIRARAMPAAYESDVRVRGTASFGGRSYIYATGTVKQTLRGGAPSVTSIEYLLDPASGLVAIGRVVVTNGKAPITAEARPQGALEQ